MTFARRTMWRLAWAALGTTALLGALVACASWAQGSGSSRFANAHVVAEDTGERVPITYFVRRAWVQITRDLQATEVPPTVPLDLAAMATRRFAVSWLGHASLLLRAGSRWVLIDPMLSPTAGPVAGVGPARLTPLPLAAGELPHIDLVLISHDHYDHLDAPTLRRLAGQAGGAPRFFVGKGLRPWFATNIGAAADEFDWWQSRTVDDLTLTFVPAQHNSGRSGWRRNTTLWGGWVVAHAQREQGPQRFYFPGDTAYVAAMFREIGARAGPIDLAAMPIGAYQPRALMRHEHIDPDDAVAAHLDAGAARSFGVHWGTLQLGDEAPFEPARDLNAAVRRRSVANFGLLPIGAVLDVQDAGDSPQTMLAPPGALAPARAASPKPH
jgi:N-acyl-phosphatidylethanolamine-hydrolysing phospholipase D